MHSKNWGKKKALILLSVVSVLSGCKNTISFSKISTAIKSSLTLSTNISATPTPTSISSATPAPSPIQAGVCTIHVGKGTGEDLTISQAGNNLHNSDVVCIHSGKYGSISISKITASDATPILIQNEGGVVDSASGFYIDNLTNVVLSGAGTAGVTYGLTVHDYFYRGVQHSGNFRNYTIQNLSMINLGDLGMTFVTPSTAYDGTDATVAYLNLKFTNIKVSNCSAFIAIGSGPSSTSTQAGVSKNMEISYSTVDSGNPGSPIWLGGSYNVNIHHNSFTNLNLNLNHHNGLIFLLGDGHVHHNYFNNILGNGVRAWPASINSVGLLRIDHNIFLNSIKYSPFEVQPFTSMIGAASHTTYTNIIYEKNTAGNVNTGVNLPDAANFPLWVAGLVDVYSSIGGTLTLQNNVLFNINNPKYSTFPDILTNWEGDWPANVYTQTGNQYFPSSQAAGLGTGNLVFSDVDRLLP